jgi:hypothetical protein
LARQKDPVRDVERRSREPKIALDDVERLFRGAKKTFDDVEHLFRDAKKTFDEVERLICGAKMTFDDVGRSFGVPFSAGGSDADDGNLRPAVEAHGQEISPDADVDVKRPA